MSPQQSFLHHVDGAEEPLSVATLLSANEEHTVLMLLTGAANELILLERQCERLLAEDVFARFERFNGDLNVPVVRRHDADDVDVFAIENTAIVGAGERLTVADPLFTDRLSRMAAVDVAANEDVAESVVGPCVSLSHPAESDTADPRTIVR